MSGDNICVAIASFVVGCILAAIFKDGPMEFIQRKRLSRLMADDYLTIKRMAIETSQTLHNRATGELITLVRDRDGYHILPVDMTHYIDKNISVINYLKDWTLVKES